MDKDNKPDGSSKRKSKFAPKAQPRRRPQPTAQQLTPEVDDEDRGAAETRALLRLAHANQVKKEPKVDKKSSVQVTFGHVPETSSTSLRTFNFSRDGKNGKLSGSGVQGSSSDHEHISFSSPSAAHIDKMDTSSVDVTGEYRPPWDYRNSYYPTTLPLRRPYAGDPEILDEAEFGEDARKSEYDESNINPASDLGLLEKSEDARMLFVQLPTNLPLVKRSAPRKGKEIVDSSKPMNNTTMRGSEKCSGLEDLQGGYVGKMLVYKSGAIKWKLGDVLYDVSPGSDCVFSQYVAAINTEKKSCCVVGELGKRMVVTPNVDSLLDSTINLD